MTETRISNKEKRKMAAEMPTRKEKEFNAAMDIFADVMNIRERLVDVYRSNIDKEDLLAELIDVIEFHHGKPTSKAVLLKGLAIQKIDVPKGLTGTVNEIKHEYALLIADNYISKDFFGMPDPFTGAPNPMKFNKNVVFCANKLSETLGVDRYSLYDTPCMNPETANECLKVMYGEIMKTLSFAYNDCRTVLIDTSNTDLACIMYSMVTLYKKTMNHDLVVGFFGTKKMPEKIYGRTVVTQSSTGTLYLVKSTGSDKIRALYELSDDQNSIKPLKLNHRAGTFLDDSTGRWVPINVLGLTRVQMKDFIVNDKVSAYAKSYLISVLSDETVSVINKQIRIVDKNVYDGNYDADDYVIHVGAKSNGNNSLAYHVAQKGAHYVNIAYGIQQ